jgi:anti-anti-sigma regulatory factor
MKVRVDTTAEGNVVVVYVAGRLGGNEVTVLRQACAQIEGTFVLDLSRLQFADDAGLDLIRAISAKGTKVRAASVFVQMLIDGQEQTADGEDAQSQEKHPLLGQAD